MSRSEEFFGADGSRPVIDDAVYRDQQSELATQPSGPAPRWAFAATRVVMLADYDAAGSHSFDQPGDHAEIEAGIDWTATAFLRRDLDLRGFGVAEAMDTAQRFAIGWRNAKRLIGMTGELRLDHGFIAGAGADQLDDIQDRGQLITAVVEQASFIREQGGLVILLPLPWLLRAKFDEDGFVAIYRDIIAELEGPLFVHWLGEVFLPELRGYFPGESFSRIMALDPEKVRGCKLSLLDAEFERRTRRELGPRGQLVLTGDDFNFAGLILGGEPSNQASVPPVEGRIDIGGCSVGVGDFSHALLGVLDAVAAPASVAMAALARGDAGRYLEIMEPCEVLGRHLFASPTYAYKSGLAFLSWLIGRQENPMLVNHEERSRDLRHYLKAAELAAKAGVIEDAALASERLETMLDDGGIDVGKV